MNTSTVENIASVDSPENQEVRTAADDPYVTILIGQNGSRQQVELTFRQFMKLPELHEGGVVTDTLRTLEQKLQEMGVLESTVVDPKNRAPGQHERIVSTTPQSPEQIQKAEALLKKWSSNSNGQKKKKK